VPAAFLREIGGESVIVVRDAQGAVRAFYNVCRHRGTRICSAPEGSFTGRIQCPCHGWSYGLDGRLLGAPHMDETGFVPDHYPLHAIQTCVWDGHLFLHFGSNPEPLSRQLADLPEKFALWWMHELRLYRRIIYDVNANWKLIVQNYNECLHCPFLHPVLNRLTDYLVADNDPPASTYIGGAMGFRDGVETMSTDGKMRRNYFPGLGEEERRKVLRMAFSSRRNGKARFLRRRCHRVLGSDQSRRLENRRVLANGHSVPRLLSRALFPPGGPVARG
jgi:Rieske 2Fe-2S family protein